MRIINFGQMVDLEDGMRVAHQITVESPSGQRHQVLTDEQTVEQLVDIAIGGGRDQPPQRRTLGEMLDEGAASDMEGLVEEAYSGSGSVFGGHDPG